MKEPTPQHRPFDLDAFEDLRRQMRAEVYRAVVGVDPARDPFDTPERRRRHREHYRRVKTPVWCLACRTWSRCDFCERPTVSHYTIGSRRVCFTGCRETAWRWLRITLAPGSKWEWLRLDRVGPLIRRNITLYAEALRRGREVCVVQESGLQVAYSPSPFAWALPLVAFGFVEALAGKKALYDGADDPTVRTKHL